MALAPIERLHGKNLFRKIAESISAEPPSTGRDRASASTAPTTLKAIPSKDFFHRSRRTTHAVIAVISARATTTSNAIGSQPSIGGKPKAKLPGCDTRRLLCRIVRGSGGFDRGFPIGGEHGADNLITVPADARHPPPLVSVTLTLGHTNNLGRNAANCEL